jgi:signal transduction histidine kinase
MRRAIGNLLDNAQRYATSVVTVRVTDDRNHTTFAVDDDGPGIEAADRDAVFQRFTRLDDARDRDAGGSGLGLPIVRELAHRAGGTVTLSDGPDGRGLSARITIPSRTSGGQSS